MYAFRTVLDPTLLSLNLRIHAFIEACRTIPLPYTPNHRSTPAETPKPLTDLAPDLTTDERYQTDLLLRGQKLYASVELLRRPEDRATYLKELENVGGLLAYKVPELSPMSRYLDQARRESVAEQISRAILCEHVQYPHAGSAKYFSDHSNLPAISHLEHAVRYNSALWDKLNELQVKVPQDSNRPPGVSLPPQPTNKGASSLGEKKPTAEVSFVVSYRPWDLTYVAVLAAIQSRFIS